MKMEHQSHRVACYREYCRLYFSGGGYMLLCNAKRQYLLTRKVIRYCLLALHDSIRQFSKPWASQYILVQRTTSESQLTSNIVADAGGEAEPFFGRMDG